MKSIFIIYAIVHVQIRDRKVDALVINKGNLLCRNLTVKKFWDTSNRILFFYLLSRYLILYCNFPLYFRSCFRCSTFILLYLTAIFF